MNKFIEIEEKDLCPICGNRLFYQSMPMRSEYDYLADSRTWPKAYYCSKCDKYFKVENEENKENLC